MTADVAAQQATVNLFADMGVQPASLMSGLVAATQSTDTTAPTTAVTSPADGSTVGGNTTVVVTGTASDTGGGVVGGVEVSTDGGTTWSRADGRESWTYSFNVPFSGTVDIMARSVDDSGNLGNASPSITVTIDNTLNCPCSIWTPLDTPDGSDPSAFATEVGVKFGPRLPATSRASATTGRPTPPVPSRAAFGTSTATS